MVMHVVKACGGIAAAAHGLDAEIELARPQLLTALEHHVLEKVGHAAFLAAFKDAARPTPEIEADQGSLRQRQGDHPGAIG